MAVSVYDTNDEGLVPDYTLPPDRVGLTPTRPFRFCVWRMGSDTSRTVMPGDDPDPSSDVGDTVRAIRYDSTANAVPPHGHTFYEICLVHRGTARQTTATGYTELKRGSVVLVCPGGVHAYDRLAGFEYTDIYLHPEWLLADLSALWTDEGLVRFLMADALFKHSVLGGVVSFELSEAEVAACERELTDVNLEAQKEKPSLTLFNACFLKILWNLNTGFRGSFGAAFDMAFVPEVWEGARLIELTIQANEPLDTATIARGAGLSPARFRESFRACTGLNVPDYYQLRRIQLAARWLLMPGVTVAQVAHQFGYSDSSHFSRFFRRFMGVSPKEYRKA